MREFLRTTPPRRLIAIVVAAILIVGVGTTLAAAGGGATPPAKSLANAIHDALQGPRPQGISATITFTNRLIASNSLQGSDPILTGADGRLWLGQNGKFRLELQSENGDAQIISDGKTFWVYDTGTNTVYRGDLPKSPAGAEDSNGTTPSLDEISKLLSQVARHVNLSGATPDNVGGEQAYSVRLSPQHDGGLLGSVETAFDAARGVPLRLGVYAADNSSPVLELKASGISYDAVPDGTFAIQPPSDAKVVNFNVPSQAAGTDRKGKAKAPPVTGLDAVSKKVDFKLSAPDALAGLPRGDVKLLDWKGTPAALVTYGRNLGAVVIVEQKAGANDAAGNRSGPTGATGSTGDHGGHGDHGDHGGLSLPSISINGATGQELDTALGTLLTFERDGVKYTVVGSVPAAAAEAAARDL